MLKSLTTRVYHLRRTWRWLSHLRASQLWARASYKTRTYWYRTPLYPLTWETPAPLTSPVLTPNHLWPTDSPHGAALAKGTFTLVGHTVNMADGIRWLPRGHSPLWLFELHYWDWLPHLLSQPNSGPVAQDYLTDWLYRFGQRWHAVVWHPYPLSLRLVNWLTQHEALLRDAPSDLTESFWSSLQHQVGHLEDNLEWDLGGNHLIKNLKALIYAGLCLPGRQTLYLEALNLLLEQLSIQILPDGLHYERSPLYHAQVLGDLLDIQALLRKAGQPLPPQLEDVLERMGNALALIRHPDGGLSLFNDSAIGNIAQLDALQSRTGLPNPLPSELSHGGLLRLTGGDWTVLLDAGKIGPDDLVGHAHADTLSFEASLGQQRVFVNSGTYAYQDKLRLPLRHSAAHNTAVVDSTSHAEVFGNFRVGRRPQQVSAELRHETSGMGATAQHDGYAQRGLTHMRRLFVAADGSSLRGEDELIWNGKKPAPQKVQAYFHVVPNCTIQLKSEQEVHLTLPANGQPIHLRLVCKNGRWLDKPGIYCPQFGEKHETRQLLIQAKWPQEGKAPAKSLRLAWAMQKL